MQRVQLQSPLCCHRQSTAVWAIVLTQIPHDNAFEAPHITSYHTDVIHKGPHSPTGEDALKSVANENCAPALAYESSSLGRS